MSWNPEQTQAGSHRWVRTRRRIHVLTLSQFLYQYGLNLLYPGLKTKCAEKGLSSSNRRYLEYNQSNGLEWIHLSEFRTGIEWYFRSLSTPWGVFHNSVTSVDQWWGIVIVFEWRETLSKVLNECWVSRWRQVRCECLRSTRNGWEFVEMLSLTNFPVKRFFFLCLFSKCREDFITTSRRNTTPRGVQQ